MGIPSNPVDRRQCRGGCRRVETICHLLQSCHITHWERIARHNEILKKVANNTKTTWPIELEPHVRHQTGRLFKPDLAVHMDNDLTAIVDVQVSWEGDTTLAAAWANKRLVYHNDTFFEAAQIKWPNRHFVVLPLIVGARGTWPKANHDTSQLLNIKAPLKNSIIQSVMKHGSSIHNAFMRAVWSRR